MGYNLNGIVKITVFWMLLFQEINADVASEDQTNGTCTFDIYLNESKQISLNYTKWENATCCTWIITAEDKSKIFVRFLNFNIGIQDLIVINDAYESVWTFSYGSDVDGRYIPFSSNQLNITFHKEIGYYSSSPFELQVTPQENGGCFTGSATLTYQSNNSIVNDTWYLFKTKKEMQVEVKLSAFEGFPSDGITFFDGETTNNILNHFRNVNDIYSIFSTTDALLMRVQDSLNSSFYINFTEIEKGMNTLSQQRTGAYQLINSATEKEGNYIWDVKPTNVKDTEQISLSLVWMKKIDGNYLTIQEGLADKNEAILNMTLIDIERTLHFPVQEGIRITYFVTDDQNQSINSPLFMNYRVIPECIYQLPPLPASGKSTLISSPGYPTNYPFNVSCQWFITTEKPEGLLHLSFKDIDVHPGHNFSIQTNDNSSTLITTDDDLIIFSNNSNIIEWTTDFVGIYDKPYRGFRLAAQSIDCGEVFNKKEHEFSTPQNITLKKYCIWKIDVSNEPSPSNIILTIVSDNDLSVGSELTIYDGGNLNSSQIKLTFNNGTAKAISHGSKVLITFLANNDANSTYHINYTYNKCEETCANNMCMHPDWKCDGKNDCGDNSDELDCLFYNCGNPDSPLNVTNSTNIILNETDIFLDSIFYCNWTLQATDNKTLVVKILDLALNYGKDVLLLNDGKDSLSPVLGKFTNTSENIKETILVTSNQYLWINFFSVQNGFIPTFNIEVIPQDVGGHFHGKHILNIANQEKDEISYFFLESEDNEQILVNYNITTVAIPSYELCFYDHLLTPENKLICFISDEEAFPLVSSSNNMIVTAKNFYNNFSANINIENIPSGNNFFTSETSGALKLFSVSEGVYTWRIKPKEKGIIVFSLKYLALYKNETVQLIEGMNIETGTVIKKFEHPLENDYIINIDSEKGALIIYHCSHSKSNSNSYPLIPTIEAFFEVLPNSEFQKNIVLNSQQDVFITTPNYPNQYPLNAISEWFVKLSSNLSHIVFEDIDLQPEDKLIISTNPSNGTNIITVYGTDLPDDLVVAETYLYLKWSSKYSNANSSLGKGFKIKIRGIDCGGNFTNTASSFKLPSNDTECVWIVTGTQYSMIDFKEVTKSQKESQRLVIFDGGSIRSNRFENVSLNTQLLSRYNKLLFYYNLKNLSTENNDEITVSYSVLSCSKKSERCGNNICLHPDWLCNNENNCGDNTDELNCTSSPTKVKTGMSDGGVIGIFFMSIILGTAFGFFVVPLIVKKYKNWRNNQFERLPENTV